MTIRFLDAALVQAIQVRLIDRYGGAHGLRDAHLLQSALDRSENRYHYAPETSVAQLAAALGWGLIKNHVFLDGNKRIGLAAVITFLEGNGHMLSCDGPEAEHMTLRAAASELTEAEWTAWLERVVQRIV